MNIEGLIEALGSHYDADEAAVIERVLREHGAPERTRLWAMMETPNAILNAGQIAACAADSSSRCTMSWCWRSLSKNCRRLSCWWKRRWDARCRRGFRSRLI